MNIEVRKLLKDEKEYLNKIINWMYKWWGNECGYSIEKIRCIMEHSICSNKVPQTYIALVNGEIVGMYQFNYNDLECRPDVNPWLCNVYVDEKYRKKGISKKMLETVKENAKIIGIEKLYLFTRHIGLYEKYGWEFVEEIETFREEQHMQRLYKLEIK